MFKGSFVALITPFRDGAVDETAFQEHVAWQLGQGTHGLVPIGTTGECPALEDDEQEGLYQHFKAVHDAVDLPIVIYNIPVRTAVDMSVQTMARLAQLPNIVGVKDSTNDLTRPTKTRLAIDGEFSMLSGEDATAVAFL